MIESEGYMGDSDEVRDTEGRLVKNIERSLDGEIIMNSEFSYTQDGQLKTITNRDATGSLISEEHKFYDEKNRLCKRVETSGDGRIIHQEDNRYEEGMPDLVEKTVFQGGQPNERIVYTYEYLPNQINIKESVIKTDDNKQI